MMNKRKMVVAVATAALLSGCTSYRMTGTQAGMLAGAAVGAGAGQLIGGNTKSTLIGTAAGAVAGGVWGLEEERKRQGVQTYGY